jgi:stearoyl-CoA desaturase (delta-9 desaturase)
LRDHPLDPDNVAATTTASDAYHDDIIYPHTIPFVLMHVACFAAIWTGVTWKAAAIGFILYWVRMFGVTGGYHRYFSHRSYKTSRFFQFILAMLAQSSTQKNVLWWAGVHRHHHKHSDTEEDVHSPRHRGFWYSHFGWIFDQKFDKTDTSAVTDLTKYPELRFLQRFEQFPSILLAIACYAVAGWPGLVVGFVWSTVVLYHCTFFINSLAHVHGNQRYVTGDDSRNNWWLAVITMGEGWHNNHHAYQRAARQGFRWYEVDFTFYILTALSWMGVVWDLGKPPVEVVRNERPLGRATVEKIARQIAESWDIEHLKARMPHPHLPTMDEIRARAKSMKMPHTPSMDEICARAHELLAQAVAQYNNSGMSPQPA